jgi:DNA-binding transcriptional ArsR family regulator
MIHNHMVVDSLSTTFMALSDPTRRAILGRLAHGPASVRELTVPFAMSQQAISKHLAYLERARLIDKQRQGRHHLCMLNPAPFSDVTSWVEECREFWAQSFGRLDAVLEEMKQEENPRGKP